MKGFVKALIAGAIIIGIGIAVLILALGLNGWSFAPDFEMQEYVSTEVNTSVSINLQAGRLKLEYSNEEEIKVSYPTAKGFETNFDETDGKLTVEGNAHKWYRFTWGVTIPETVITIPEGTVTELSVTVNAGTVEIPDGEFESISIKLNAGACTVGNITGLQLLDIDMNAGALNIAGATGNRLVCEVNAGAASIKKINCDTTEVKVSAGAANLTFAGEKTDYTATVNVSAGSCNGLSTQTGGEKQISVKVSAGGCNVSFAG